MANTSLIPKRPLSLEPAALCRKLSLTLRSREWMQAHRDEAICDSRPRILRPILTMVLRLPLSGQRKALVLSRQSLVFLESTRSWMRAPR